MNIEPRLIDHLTLTCHLSKYFACSYSEDDRIFILSDIGVYVLALKCSLQSTFPNFSCSKHFFPLSEYIAAANIDLDLNCFHKDLERKHLYETVLSGEYSANLNNTKRLDNFPICAEWSPSKIVDKTSCLLAVLSSWHNLEIYVKVLDENELPQYHCIANVTKEIIEHEKLEWKNSIRFAISLKLEEFKKRIEQTVPSAFTWSHVFEEDSKYACVIFTGHINGNITVWKINERDAVCRDQSDLKFLVRYSTKLNRISALTWNQMSKYGGALCFGDVDGKISTLHVSELNKDKAKLERELPLFVEGDKLMVEKITVMDQYNKTFLVVSKQNNLMIYGIDELGLIFDSRCYYVQEYYITGVQLYENNIYFLTLPGKLIQLNISLKDGRIMLKEKKISLKMDKPYRTHGFLFSKNMMFFGVLTYPWELQQFGRTKAYTNLLIYNNASLNPMEILWKNNSGSLQNYWDCFEILRLLCIKEKRFPWLGLPKSVNYDDLSILQLKTLRYVSQLSESIFDLVPIVRDYDIKPYVLIHYLVEIKLVVKRLKKLLMDVKFGKELSLFQMRSMDVQIFFLKEMVVNNILPKSKVGVNFVQDISAVMEVANELNYPDMPQCVWCGEKIIGPSCLPPHADTRCSVSMMPIFLIPSYKCPFCKSLCHEEIEKEQNLVLCPYCDIPMDRIPPTIGQKENEDVILTIPASGEVKSDCFEDCLREEITLKNIEDNAVDILIESSSESDSEELELHKLYLSMTEFSMEEFLKLKSENLDVEINDSPDVGTKNVKVSHESFQE